MPKKKSSIKYRCPKHGEIEPFKHNNEMRCPECWTPGKVKSKVRWKEIRPGVFVRADKKE